MIVSWIKFFVFAVSPDRATAEERPRFARMANWIKYFGLVILACAIMTLIWWATERQSYGKAPAEPVAVQDFSEQDLGGKLMEARVEGVLQLDRMQPARTAYGSMQTLIPFTPRDWTPDNPVRVFVQTHLFLYDQQIQRSGASFARGLALMNLSERSQGATAASIIVRQPRETADAQQITGVETENPVIVEYVNEAWRARDIGWDTDIYRTLAGILGMLGLFLATLGYFARRSLLGYKE